MAVYGYMRVSTEDKQSFGRQETQLEAYGVDKVYADKVSGSKGKKDRPELSRLIDELQEGDTLVILSIDRLARSVKHMLQIVEEIKDKKASVISIQDSWLDTSGDNPMSDFLMHIFSALAEMERKMIVKRVNEGLRVAKDKGKTLGRPTVDKEVTEFALQLYDEGKNTAKEIADMAGISERTLYRKVKKRNIQLQQTN